MSPQCRNKILTPAACAVPQPNIFWPLYQFPITTLYWWNTSLQSCAGCPDFGVGFLKSPIRRSVCTGICLTVPVSLKWPVSLGKEPCLSHLYYQKLVPAAGSFTLHNANSQSQVRYFCLLRWFVQAGSRVVAHKRLAPQSSKLYTICTF